MNGISPCFEQSLALNTDEGPEAQAFSLCRFLKLLVDPMSCHFHILPLRCHYLLSLPISGTQLLQDEFVIGRWRKGVAWGAGRLAGFASLWRQRMVEKPRTVG